MKEFIKFIKNYQFYIIHLVLDLMLIALDSRNKAYICLIVFDLFLFALDLMINERK